jgi:hypothetical protein
MGATYKPEDARRRRIKDKALKDLDPSLRGPAKRLIESHGGEDLERKLTKRSKKTRDLIEKK